MPPVGSEFTVLLQKCLDLSVVHVQFSETTSDVSFEIVFEELFEHLDIIFLWEVWRLASRGWRLAGGGREESIIHRLELSELGNLLRIFEVEYFAESPPDQSHVLELPKLEYDEDGFLSWEGRIPIEAEAQPPEGYPELRQLGLLWHYLHLININGLVVSSIRTKCPNVWSLKLASQLRKVIFFIKNASCYKLQSLLITLYLLSYSSTESYWLLFFGNVQENSRKYYPHSQKLMTKEKN